jgi:hypothetical protein
LARHYTLDGLKTLCFNLFIDYDNLSGDTKNAKGASDLHLERAGRLADKKVPFASSHGLMSEFAARHPAHPSGPARPRQVSISHGDTATAHRLAGDLQANGWRVWIARAASTPARRGSIPSTGLEVAHL